jgi:flagellar biosynthesis protein FliR
MSDVWTMSSLEGAAAAFVLVLARVSSFIATAPILGQGTVPNSVKLGLCLALAIFWLPGYTEVDFTTGHGSALRFGLALLMESIVGLSVGYVTRLLFLPAKVAGSYVGQELGFNLGQVADPSTGTSTNETGLIFDAWALVLFWITDTHHTTLRMLDASIGFAGGREFVYGLAPEMVRLVSAGHQLGILMVAPLATLLFAALISLAVLMRAWSHITLFSFGIGARLLLGLLAFFVLVPLVLENMARFFPIMADQAIEVFTVGP